MKVTENIVRTFNIELSQEQAETVHALLYLLDWDIHEWASQLSDMLDKEHVEPAALLDDSNEIVETNTLKVAR